MRKVYLLSLLLAAAGCNASAPLKATREPAVARLIQLARDCLVAADGGAGRVTWTRASVRRDRQNPAIWSVEFPSASPVRVDLVTWSCAGAALKAERLDSTLHRELTALLALARRCAADAGAGERRAEDVTFDWTHPDRARILASVETSEPQTLPSGIDLMIDPERGTCGPAISD